MKSNIQSNKTQKDIYLKRYGNIYESIRQIEVLRLAHYCARKDKMFYKEVKRVNANEDLYLYKIQDMLDNNSYTVSEYTVSTIIDKNKQRELSKLPYFPDRIIQWAILLRIEPIFSEVFIDQTCASLKGRGIHKALYYLSNYLKDVQNTTYCLKIDVKQFYANINHAILKKLLRKKFKDQRLLHLLDMIIDSIKGEKGIPIGTYLSQFSQIFICHTLTIGQKKSLSVSIIYVIWMTLLF